MAVARRLAAGSTQPRRHYHPFPAGIPGRVDEMWGTDLTATWTGQGQAAVFVALDHRSAECVGIHAALRANRFGPTASRPWSRSAKASGVTSGHSRRTRPG